MKFVFLVGGFVGFALGGGASLGADHEPGRAFLDAGLGCLAGAVLFRWFWNVLVRGVEETLRARRVAPATEAAAEALPATVAAKKK